MKFSAILLTNNPLFVKLNVFQFKFSSAIALIWPTVISRPC